MFSKKERRTFVLLSSILILGSGCDRVLLTQTHLGDFYVLNNKHFFLDKLITKGNYLVCGNGSFLCGEGCRDCSRNSSTVFRKILHNFNLDRLILQLLLVGLGRTIFVSLVELCDFSFCVSCKFCGDTSLDNLCVELSICHNNFLSALCAQCVGRNPIFYLSKRVIALS